MNILVLYGTTEGHTRKIATVVADQLREAGHQVALVDAQDQPTGLDRSQLDAVVIAARVHAGGHQHSILRFVRRHSLRLNAVPSAFISVSMAAAGHCPGDLDRARGYAARFQQESGWHPRHTHLAAGARLYAQHSRLGRIILGLVDRHRYDPTRDHEFTDWSGLRKFIASWICEAQHASQEP